jgi:fibronectin-binding autotransporter adhesin
MANTFFKLDSATVGAGGVSTVVFNNIPQTYNNLVLKVSARSLRASDEDSFGLAPMGNGATKWTLLSSNGSSASTGTSVSLGFGSSFTARIPGANATASTFSNLEITIPDYTSSTQGKSFSVDGTQENNSTTAYTSLLTGYYASTSPITSITMLAGNANLAQYTTITLYGVFNTDVSSAPNAPTIGTATAGASSASITFTGVANAASYTMTSSPGGVTATGSASPITVSGLTAGTPYTFTCKANNPLGSSASSAASNSVTPYALPSSIEVLVVAGGGSGGRSDVGAGGGGAGGLSYQAARSITAGTYTVTVGSGGATTTSSGKGNAGSNSVFDTITSNGGEGGAGRNTTMTSGGCGGGGPAESPNLYGTSNQGSTGGATGFGFRGGTGENSFPYFLNGGGGGTGAVGGNGGASNSGGVGGTGGVGKQYWNNNSSGTNYYGGGGGGGTYSTGGNAAGAGGLGGGGAAGATGSNPGIPGTANTGGGGGGNSSAPSNPADGGAGGSGIVTLRYADTFAAASSTSGSPTINVANGYRTYTWTGSGSITF